MFKDINVPLNEISEKHARKNFLSEIYNRGLEFSGIVLIISGILNEYSFKSNIIQGVSFYLSFSDKNIFYILNSQSLFIALLLHQKSKYFKLYRNIIRILC